MSAGSTQDKWYLVQVDMDHLGPVLIRNYGLCHCQWYIRQYEDCKKYPTMKCQFWPEIRTKDQGGTLGEMLSVRTSKVHKLLQNNQTYMWYQDDISLAEHRLVGPLQFGTTGRNKLKYTNMIDEKRGKELEK